MFGSHTFVPVGWSRKKQAAVSRGSTEAGVISLDAVLRIDGIPALGLWDIVTDVLEPQAQGILTRHPKKKLQMRKNNRMKQFIEDPDFVHPNAHTSGQRASLSIFRR